ncbi:MAG: AI-2E family transporter [Parvibaculaceae bacterium]|nr:AI-2E family transporter [Parvibaculaceae bacterium]
MQEEPQPISPARRDAPAPQAPRPLYWLLGLVATALALVAIVIGREFLAPLAVAILLFSLISALIDLARHFRIGSLAIPNWVATLTVSLLSAAALMVLFGLLSAQINAAVATASDYADRAEQAISALFAWLGEDAAAAAQAAFRDIDLGDNLRLLAGSAGGLLISTILVILYIGFLFAERPHFSAKFEKLFPDPERANRLRHILGAIGRSVRHYVLVKTAVSLATAGVVYVILLLLGIDFAEPIATLTFFFNFIPNIGSIAASLLPAMVALVQFGDWPMALIVLFGVGAIQFSIGNIIEPMLMGRALHLSSLAIILSLTFWGAVWGVVGLFLAVPIMVVVMIVCAHVPGLKPVAILLSRDGDLNESGES